MEAGDANRTFAEAAAAVDDDPAGGDSDATTLSARSALEAREALAKTLRETLKRVPGEALAKTLTEVLQLLYAMCLSPHVVIEPQHTRGTGHAQPCCQTK